MVCRPFDQTSLHAKRNLVFSDDFSLRIIRIFCVDYRAATFPQFRGEWKNSKYSDRIPSRKLRSLINDGAAKGSKEPLENVFHAARENYPSALSPTILNIYPFANTWAFETKKIWRLRGVEKIGLLEKGRDIWFRKERKITFEKYFSRRK